METPDALTERVIGAAITLHRDLGPGLLESAYELLLAAELGRLGFDVVRQAVIPIDYRGTRIEYGFRADLIVERRLVVEVKSAERVVPVHKRQLLTYLRLLDLPVGLVINFGAERVIDGIQRVANSRARLAELPDALVDALTKTATD